MSGAGGGAGKILLGAALIAVAIAAPGVGLFGGGAAGFGVVAGATGTAATLAAAGGTIGLALVLGGTAQLLSPTPQVPDFDGDPRNNADNFSFSGVQNVSREGVPVPVAYGEVITGSVVISAGLNVEEI